MKKTLQIKFRSQSIEGRPETKHARTLADVGMSIDTICQETGLKRGAVAYRLRKIGKKLSDYRSGRSPLGKFVKRRVYEMTKTEIKEMIKERLVLKS